MALALNSSHALASAVTALIAVDGNTGSLVDLKTARTFTVDAGVTFVDDATNGKVLRTACRSKRSSMAVTRAGTSASGTWNSLLSRPL